MNAASRIIVICLLLGLPSIHSASQEASLVIPAGFGAIRGRVTNEHGHPVPGARVYAEHPNDSTIVRSKVNFALTNSKGEFVLTQAIPGENIVMAGNEKDGYVNTFYAAFVDDRSQLLRVPVEKGKVTENVIVRLSKGGKLSGRILDLETGRPVNNCAVRVTQDENPQLYLSRTADLQARFEFILPPRPFTLEISAPGYKPWRFSEESASARSDVILLQPGELKELVVKLVKQ